MGGYWSKGDAEVRMHKAQRDHRLSESIGDKPYIGAPPTYEVREMLVAPVGLYNHSPSCITETLETKVVELEASLTVSRNSVEPLKRENERLREQIKDYRKKLDDAVVTPSSEPIIDPATLFNQLRPLLNRLSDRERRAIQQKLEEIVD
jgi:hypothetical protein